MGFLSHEEEGRTSLVKKNACPFGARQTEKVFLLLFLQKKKNLPARIVGCENPPHATA
jgi:hypothetical protein